MRDSLNDGLRLWYGLEYYDDDICWQINERATFKDLLNALYRGKDVYDVMGVGDSVVRERLFGHLARIINVDYETIYNMWLNND